MFIRSPHVRLGKFVLVDAKRLLQHYLPIGDIVSTILITVSAPAEAAVRLCEERVKIAVTLSLVVFSARPFQRPYFFFEEALLTHIWAA
jgi:hypothetical protein